MTSCMRGKLFMEASATVSSAMNNDLRRATTLFSWFRSLRTSTIQSFYSYIQYFICQKRLFSMSSTPTQFFVRRPRHFPRPAGCPTIIALDRAIFRNFGLTYGTFFPQIIVHAFHHSIL